MVREEASWFAVWDLGVLVTWGSAWVVWGHGCVCGVGFGWLRLVAS